MGEKDARDISERITLTQDIHEAVQGGDFVVEAVSEILSLKHEIFEKVDAIAPPDVILASETSGLGMTDIAARTRLSRALHRHA